MSSLWQIWAYVISFGTIGTILILALLAPSVLAVAAEFLKPIAGGLGRVARVIIDWLVNVLRVGAPHLAKSIHACVLVVLLCGGVYGYCRFTEPRVDTVDTCQKTIKNLRKDFEFKPRKKQTTSILSPSSWWPF
jgi:hypothetical protein